MFKIIIIIIIIIEFFTSQLWLGNIHVSWDVVISSIRLGGLICSLKSFLQLNMCQELQIFGSCIYVFGCRLSLVRLCDSDFGITPVDDITIGITWAAICFHIAHISFASSWYLFCLSVIVLARLCVFGTAMSIKNYYHHYYYYYSAAAALQLGCISTYYLYNSTVTLASSSLKWKNKRNLVHCAL